MKYSVIATTFNDSSEIETFMKDMLVQSCPPEEIIVADGGSKDETVNVLDRLKQDWKEKVRITIISGKRLNISQGYNAALDSVRTECVGIVGIGNRYHQDFFKYLLNDLEENPDLGIVYCRVRGQKNNKFQEAYANTFLNGDDGDKTAIATNRGVLARMNAINTLGRFYEHFIYAGEDAEFYSRVNHTNIRVKCNDSALSYWDTPSDIKEFCKQQKNYTIAEMQLSTVMQSLRASAKVFAVLILSIFASVVCKMAVIFPVFFFIMFYTYCFVIKKGFRNGWLLFLKYILRVYYLLKYRKYLKEDYKVSNNLGEKDES